MLPSPPVEAVPHCEPQNTRYTFGVPLVTPTPALPPWYEIGIDDAALKVCVPRTARDRPGVQAVAAYDLDRC